MRIVLDTNVLISALIFGGKPRTILELIVVEKKITGIISRRILDELLGVLKVKFKYLDDSPPDYLNVSIYSNCRQKVWGLVNKECEGINVVCSYKKDYTFYTLLRS